MLRSLLPCMYIGVAIMVGALVVPTLSLTGTLATVLGGLGIAIVYLTEKDMNQWNC